MIEGYSTLGLAEPLGVICDAVRAAGRAGLDPGGRATAWRPAFPPWCCPSWGAGDRDRQPGGHLRGGGPLPARPGRPARPAGGARGPALGRRHQPEPDPLPGPRPGPRPGGPAAHLPPRRRDRLPSLAGPAQELRRGGLGTSVPWGRSRPRRPAPCWPTSSGCPGPRGGRRADAPGRAQPLRPARSWPPRRWSRAGSIPPPGGGPGTGPLELPWTLAESIQGRAAALEPPERELIAWAAAIGERFDLRLLSARADLPRTRPSTSLDEPDRAGLVVEDPADPGATPSPSVTPSCTRPSRARGWRPERGPRHRAILDAAEALAADGGSRCRPPSWPDTPWPPASGAGDRALARGGGPRAEARGGRGGGRPPRARPGAVERRGRAAAAGRAAASRAGRLRTRLARGDVRAVELLEQARAEYSISATRATRRGASRSWRTPAGAAARSRAFRSGSAPFPDCAEGPARGLRGALATYARALAVREARR